MSLNGTSDQVWVRCHWDTTGDSTENSGYGLLLIPPIHLAKMGQLDILLTGNIFI